MHVEFGFGNVLTIKGAIQLALDFGAGSLGISEKACEFGVGSSIESFRNIVHGRSRRAIDLIAEGEVFAKASAGYEFPDALVQLPSKLPSIDVLKSFK